MAMFVDIYGSESIDTEEKVARSSTQNDGQTEPNVVCHEHQHQQVADGDLEHVEKGLDQMALVEQTRARIEYRETFLNGNRRGFVRRWNVISFCKYEIQLF